MILLLFFIQQKNIQIFNSTYLKNSDLNNCEVISDDKIKNYILQKSVFAVAKSGTVSLEICNAKYLQ